MKKFFTLSLLAVAAQVASALDIVYDEPFTEALAGTAVTDVVRSASVFFFGEYGFDYDRSRTGMPGEYIIADDGSIYIKEPISGYQFGTYLKLDKVDEETYVAHTLQVAAVSSALEPVFVVRLVFNQLSETSYTYQLEQDEAGNDITDIYFTLKDGTLQQRDREIFDLNGVPYPHEIIALCNTTTGDWNGYGDGLLKLEKVSASLPTPPADAEIAQATLTYTSLYDYNAYSYPEAGVTSMAEVGDQLYVSYPSTDLWFVGTIDREAGTVTFGPQYVGATADSHMWLVPAIYNDSREMIDEEIDYGLWYRYLSAAESCVMSYKNGVVTAGENQALVFSANETTEKALKSFCDFSVKPGVAKADAKPANPSIQRFSPYDDFWWEGSMTWFAAPLDTKGYALDVNDLYFNVYHDGVAEPHTFTYYDSHDLTGPTVDMPFFYTGDSFTCVGARHRFYFYEEWQDVGIQLVYRHEGNEKRSDIVYALGNVIASDDADASYDDANALQTVHAVALDGLRMENGRLVISKDGVKYNIVGSLVK